MHPGVCEMDFESKVGSEVWKAMQSDGAKLIEVAVIPTGVTARRTKPRKPRGKTPLTRNAQHRPK